MTIKDQLAPVGEEWQINIAIEEIKERRRENNDVRRYRIAYSVVSGIAAGATGLGAYGLYSGSFAAVSGFWTATGPIFGAIIGYYFGKNGDTG